MHSDQNYFVDQSLFGSASSRVLNTSNRSTRSQILFKGKEENLEQTIQSLLTYIGIKSTDYRITFVHPKDACAVKFQNSNECELIMDQLKEEIKRSNIQISVEWFEPKDDRNVYVRNLPLQYTEMELKDLFKCYGSIISVKLIQKHQNNNCIAFVRYQNSSEADKAINGINNQKLNLIGTDRFVHCELSKIYNTHSSPIHDNTHNYSAISQQIPVFYSNQNYGAFQNIQNPNMIGFPQQHHQMQIHQMQHPSFIGNAVAMPIIYGHPQEQIDQHEFVQNQIFIVPYDPYMQNQ